ncbi:MAG: hypothetical protein Phog2KO_22090 [Phototrophicaceae bacterium]
MRAKKQKRGRRDQRPENPKPIRLTERDLDILQMLDACRLLSTQHVQTLFFPSKHRAYARLQALYHHAFVDRLFLGVQTGLMNTAILYIIDKRGVELLRAKRGLTIEWSAQIKQVKPTFLEHALAINDVRVAVTKACENHSSQLGIWLGENDLKSDYDYVQIRNARGRMEGVSLIPDSYFNLALDTGTTHFFLEQDMGTMQLSRFKQKVWAYLAYSQSGLSEKRFSTKKFRVLTVANSKQRALNLKQATEEAGGQRRFWFTSREQVDVKTALDAPIWWVAGDSKPTSLFT